ncbi:MAG: hypothetical protein ABSB87_11105 [Terriglobales bacterium]
MSDDTMSDDTRSEPPISVEESGPSPTAAAPRGAPADLAADLLRSAADPLLTEDLALALLKRPDIPPEVLEQFARNANALKSRKVKIALVSHPHTPRHVSVPLARQFYTFDLMKVALSPVVPADVKVAVDDVLISRLRSLTERSLMARSPMQRQEIIASSPPGLRPARTESCRPHSTTRDLPKRSSSILCSAPPPAQIWCKRLPGTRSGLFEKKSAPPFFEPNISRWHAPWNSAGKYPLCCCEKCSPVRVSQKRSKTNYSKKGSHRDHGAPPTIPLHQESA